MYFSWVLIWWYIDNQDWHYSPFHLQGKRFLIWHVWHSPLLKKKKEAADISMEDTSNEVYYGSHTCSCISGKSSGHFRNRKSNWWSHTISYYKTPLYGVPKTDMKCAVPGWRNGNIIKSCHHIRKSKF